MAVPILSRRRERRQADLTAAIDAGVEKALSPFVAGAAANGTGTTVSGASYMINPSSPFAQTAGSQVGSQPLPRPIPDFNSLFGPGTPLFPDPLDPLGPNGRTMPRRAQYLVSVNLQLLDRATPWTALKWLAEECDIVNRCIQLVQDGLTGREWSWGFSDNIIQQIMTENHEPNHARAMDIAKQKYGSELDRVKQFFERPDQRSKHSFSQFLSEIIWQSLVYDGVVIYPQYNLGGDLIALSPIDTSTIKILLDNQGFPPEPPAPAYQQILYGFPRGEFQASDGDITGEYMHDQLAYYIRRPRPESVYGYPPVEEVMTIAATYLERQAWMRSEYTYGAMPKVFMEIAETDQWSPEQSAYYETSWNARLSGQVQRRQQAFFLRPGMKPTFAPQIDEHYKSDYDNFLIIQIASKFGVPGTQVGVQAKAGLSGGRMMEGEEDQTEHFVYNALIAFFIDVLNDLARRYMGVGPEITATCKDVGGSEQDIVQQATADATVVGFGGMTINDYRAKNGQPLYDLPEADEPFINVATGPVFLKGTLAVQDANTENTLNPPEPPKQVMVGMDGKPVPTDVNGAPIPQQPPTEPGGTSAAAPASDSDADSGHQPVSSGDGGGKTDADGNTDLGPTGGSGSGSTSGSDKSGSEESDTAKELATFVKFAKARLDANKSWRDFEFRTPKLRSQSALLNALASNGSLDIVKSAIDHLPIAAGIACKAEDTGRILLVQRAS